MHILIMHWPKSIQVVTIYQDLISASQYSSTLLVGTTKKKNHGKWNQSIWVQET